ncbi:flagellar motor stator protein MotA [Sphingosinicella microcystinivorans]|uniref:Chemotaxis protein MotA n=1 Tax=Sphingosinicella microcystinivorans TaxID=335406 RepID=A0AAD1D9K9_SPHMI|nr:flagellar motor stator protein MotA [Sphingosinicella microcystinivorans]RKS92215.1 chemotaxis protein MotA [Sphingosinicella microcystinivorans]BBE35236.1 flagellar motor protein MotA [Sphingosinicella microcystinivorans]
MIIFFGLAIVLVCVFGSFLIAGGELGIIAGALPQELLIIAGAAAGAFIIANSSTTLRRAADGVRRAFAGERWGKDDYRDLLCLLFLLIKTLRTRGVVAIESHIEYPEESRLFAAFPRIAADPALVSFICDYVRMMAMNFEDPNQMADAMEADLDRHVAEEYQAQGALQTLADSLPALGIVAAVLGVIKTMGSVDQPTEVLGAMIGGALVGTFLGVLLSYTVVGPIASRLAQVIDAEAKYLTLVKTVIVAHLQGQAPQVAVELGRRTTPSNHAPSFAEMEAALDALPRDLV